jgi:hypothetical protein
MHRRAPNRFHALVVKIFRQIASDVRRAIIAEQARLCITLALSQPDAAKAMSSVSVTSSG